MTPKETVMIDTHTHIYTKEFSEDIDIVIARAIESGVKKILLPNVDVGSLQQIDELCRRYEGVCYPMYGLHPTDMTKNYKQELETIFTFAEQKGNMVGVGEIGLDLYWSEELRYEQEQAFRWQVDYAIKHQKAMSIHIRNAFDMFWQIMDDYNPKDIRGVLHCFSGTSEDAYIVITEFPNLLIGVNGTITYKKSTLPDIFREHVPLDRVVIETDAPYLSPVPNRGKRNEPSNLVYVCECLAQIYHVEAQEISQKTDENACSMYKIPI